MSKLDSLFSKTARKEFPTIAKPARNERPCGLGFGTVRQCPNQCKGDCGYIKRAAQRS